VFRIAVIDPSCPVPPYSSFLPDVLGTASADTRCARHWRPFCFALLFYALRKRTAPRVSAPPQSSKATPFANPAKNFAVPRKSTFARLGATSFAFLCTSTAGQKEENHSMNLNQLSIIGFIGKNAETKYLPNGTPVTKFSVATKNSPKFREIACGSKVRKIVLLNPRTRRYCMRPVPATAFPLRASRTRPPASRESPSGFSVPQFSQDARKSTLF
jgi:hypothetical protein